MHANYYVDQVTKFCTVKVKVKYTLVQAVWPIGGVEV